MGRFHLLGRFFINVYFVEVCIFQIYFYNAQTSSGHTLKRPGDVCLLDFFRFFYNVVEQLQSFLAIGIIMRALVALEFTDIKSHQPDLQNALSLLTDAICRITGQTHTLIEICSLNL